MVSYFTFTADTAVTGLNPCCSGRWSRTVYLLADRAGKLVLILVVVEDGLVLLAMLAPGAADIES